MFQEMENLFSGTGWNQSSPHPLNTTMHGDKPILWLCTTSLFYQTFCWPWTASVLWGLFFFFLFLLLLIFSPHINYTDVLGAMCFATSQRKPQDFRSQEQPDVLGWQSPTQGSGPGCQTGWGHHLLPSTQATEETASLQNHSTSWGFIVLMFGFFFFFFLVAVITTMILSGQSCLAIFRLDSVLFPDKLFASF